jgi:hypothetical protein
MLLLFVAGVTNLAALVALAALVLAETLLPRAAPSSPASADWPSSRGAHCCCFHKPERAFMGGPMLECRPFLHTV